MTEAPLLSAINVSKDFVFARTLAQRLKGQPASAVHALNGVSLDVRKGETLGIVGESGCGKSTLARCLVRLYDCDEGGVHLEGIDISTLSGAARRAFNRRVQMVFQDPYSSLNPRMTVRQILSEALRVHAMRPADAIEARIHELLDLVRLPRDAADRYPHAFSGGQRQRIGIARALAVEPEVLVADELVSALDVSVQAQVVNLLLELQDRLALTVIFVAHDLRLVRHISHRVRGDVSRHGGRNRADRGALLRSAPSLHPGSASCGAGARSRPTHPHRRGAGRASEPDRATLRLPLPHPLPACIRALPQRGAGYLTRRGPAHAAACHLENPQTVPAPDEGLE